MKKLRLLFQASKGVIMGVGFGFTAILAILSLSIKNGVVSKVAFPVHFWNKWGFCIKSPHNLIKLNHWRSKMTSSWLKLVYNPLNKLARRIKKIMKESYSYFFVLAVASIFTILGVVIQPLFVSPLNWSNINSFNLGVVWSRFLYASPLTGLFVIVAILIIRQIKRIDKEKDSKLIEALTRVLKEAFKEALKEDREEQRTDQIKKLGD